MGISDQRVLSCQSSLLRSVEVKSKVRGSISLTVKIIFLRINKNRIIMRKILLDMH